MKTSFPPSRNVVKVQASPRSPGFRSSYLPHLPGNAIVGDRRCPVRKQSLYPVADVSYSAGVTGHVTHHSFIAAFVPITVAGQRKLYTSFP
jgi:hypothetical protein